MILWNLPGTHIGSDLAAPQILAQALPDAIQIAQQPLLVSYDPNYVSNMDNNRLCILSCYLGKLHYLWVRGGGN